MAKVKITGHASGTGVVTVTAPNTSTDRTITLPDATATLATKENFLSTGIDDNASAVKLTVSDSGINVNGAVTSLAIKENDAGNVGIGVTPEAWHSAYNGGIVQINSHGAIFSQGAETYLTNNVYEPQSGGMKYINTNVATLYSQQTGQHFFKTAASGSADAAITWTTAMTIDNSGIVTKPKQPAFDAHSTSNAYSSGTSISSLNLNATRFNVGGHYDTSTYRFTAPVAGVYQFNYRTIVNGAASNAHVRMFKNGSIINGTDSHYSASSGTAWSTWTYSSLILLAANDYVSVYHTSATSIHGNDYQSFNGHLIG